jgi:hypothetical protein
MSNYNSLWDASGVSIAARLFSVGVSAVPLCIFHKAEKDHSGRDGD